MKHSYSNNIMNKRIALLGPVPPPLGGISVHIERVAQKFRIQHNKVFHFDTMHTNYWFVKYHLYLAQWVFKHKPDIVYYHTPYHMPWWYGLLEMMVIIIIKPILRYTFVVVDHDCRYLYQRNSFFKYLFSWVIRQADHCVLIGDITYRSYKDNNITLYSFSLESSFLPPTVQQLASIISSYETQLISFCESHTPLLMVNAYQLVLLNTRDLYGIDVCIELMKKLICIYPRSGLIIALASIGDYGYYQQLQETIIANTLETNIYILTGQKQIWPLFKRIDLFVRPTLSDSFGISVAEALYFNIPALASDVCQRPFGTITFKTGDTSDFIEKAIVLLTNKKYSTYTKPGWY